MKCFYKIFFVMIIVMTLALAIVEYYSVKYSLDNSFQRELNGELTQHQLIKHAIQSSILNIKDEGNINDDDMSLIASSASDLLKNGGSLLLVEQNGKIYYSSIKGTVDLSDMENGSLRYSVGKENKRESITVKSKFIQNDHVLYLVTKQDISLIFSEADVLQKRCTRLYFIVLGICAFVAFLLAYTIAKPLTMLSNASGAFANGDYNSRVNINSKDEIGEFAGDFNKMADTIQEKIAELEAAAERQERFTANFAHELKTPMTSIIGYADTIYQKKLSTDEIRQAASFIMNEGMRLESLSFKLMDLFTVNSQNYIFEETEITTVIQDAGSTVVNIVNDRGIKFELDAEIGWVRIEYDLFKTLLVNLIDNAIKSGGKEIIVKGKSLNNKYRISIIDNGTGIPENELDKITEAFYMVDKSRSRKEHGAGLGLALCSKIAEIHNTRLIYSSEPGKGTEVSFDMVMEKIDDEK